MDITVTELSGPDVPSKYRAEHSTVWAVWIGDTVLEYCTSKPNALALQARQKALQQKKKRDRDAGLSF
ncbi:hypothetical protein BVY11_29170 [Pseudomonas amygdali pv. morsprunorum]|uniref:hypothetical protein n=1 Tax=Pseudomonas amygdali TaxID=47877 RepID=UPI000D443457|nr:hypothetical protein [Pseudomonas amygdali]PPS23757.1 hypothetical protein BVY11_29170 [Pseudomonas amygdali pv. morsprunorum]PPS32661.1 hypothetical protein BVY12_17995 [Pseudomonas amygdali pv. morsprunorum]GFZ63732.1 hypothetical protein PSE10B_02540 [Pseudomonas amygdali pv. eriobotryae]